MTLRSPVPPTPGEPLPTVVLGAGGLLGSAVARAVQTDGTLSRVPLPRVPWRDPEEAVRVLRGIAAAVAPRPRWQVLWCAGAGVAGMTREDGDVEVAVFRAFVDALAEHATGEGGTLFLASSAGGVYAGSAPAPFDEHSPTAPLSEYGHVKLRLEAEAARLGDAGPVSVLVGRYANLYGPGQDLGKQQGLISHLCLGAIERRPVSIFVPLDTIRDYLFVADAARMTLAALEEHRATASAPTRKVFASGQGATVATVITSVTAAAGTRPPIVLGASPLTSLQGRDLRMRSSVLPLADVAPVTPLGIGIAATWSDLFARFVTQGRRHA